jgi:hypothetical protein
MLVEDLLATFAREQRRRCLADLIDMLEELSALGVEFERGGSGKKLLFQQSVARDTLDSLNAYVACGGDQHDVESLRHQEALRLCLESTKP